MSGSSTVREFYNNDYDVSRKSADALSLRHALLLYRSAVRRIDEPIEGEEV